MLTGDPFNFGIKRSYLGYLKSRSHVYGGRIVEMYGCINGDCFIMINPINGTTIAAMMCGRHSKDWRELYGYDPKFDV